VALASISVLHGQGAILDSSSNDDSKSIVYCLRPLICTVQAFVLLVDLPDEVGWGVSTLALVPSAVTNADLLAIYYDCAAFLDAHLYAVLDTCLQQLDAFFPLSVFASTLTRLVILPFKPCSRGAAHSRVGQADLVTAAEILAL